MKNERAIGFIKGFIAVFVVICLCSGYLILRRASSDADNGKTLPSDISETDAEGNIIPSETFAELQGKCDILFGCAEGDKVSFLIRIDINLYDKNMTVYSIPCDTVLSYAGAYASVNDVFSSGGASALSAAVGGYYGDSFDRFFICSPDGFISGTKKLGYTDVQVKKDISYIKGDTVISLKAGRHSLNGIDLYNYLTYGAEGSELHALRSDTFASMLKAYLVNKNIDMGEDLFASLVNLGNGDITAYDYAAVSPLLDAIAASSEMEYISGGLYSERSEKR